MAFDRGRKRADIPSRQDSDLQGQGSRAGGCAAFDIAERPVKPEAVVVDRGTTPPPTDWWWILAIALGAAGVLALLAIGVVVFVGDDEDRSPQPTVTPEPALTSSPTPDLSRLTIEGHSSLDGTYTAHDQRAPLASDLQVHVAFDIRGHTCDLTIVFPNPDSMPDTYAFGEVEPALKSGRIRRQALLTLVAALHA
jgi:hypothetical protein